MYTSAVQVANLLKELWKYHMVLYIDVVSWSVVSWTTLFVSFPVDHHLVSMLPDHIYSIDENSTCRLNQMWSLYPSELMMYSSLMQALYMS